MAEPRLRRRAAVAGIAGHAVTREGMENLVGVDAPQTVGVVVGDDQVSVGPPHHAQRPAGVSLLRGYAVLVAGAGNRPDGAGRPVVKHLPQTHIGGATHQRLGIR